MVVKNNATPKLRYTQHQGNTPASTPTNTITTMTHHHHQNQNQNTTSFVTRNLHLCSSFGSNNNNNNQIQNQSQQQQDAASVAPLNFETNNNNNNKNPSFGFLPPSLLSNQNNSKNNQNVSVDEEEQQQQESNTQNVEQEEEGNHKNKNTSQRRQKFTSFYYNFELPPPHPSTLLVTSSSSSSQQQQNNNENVLNQVLDEALDSSLVCDAEKISNFSDVFVPWPTEEKSLIGKGSFGRVLRVVPRVIFDQVQQEITTSSTSSISNSSSSSFSFFCRHSSELSSSEVIFRIEQMQKQQEHQQPIVVVKELTKNNICKTPLAVNHFFGEVAATTPSSSTPKSLNKRIQVPFYSSHNNENDSFSSPTPAHTSNNNNNKNSIFHTPSSIYLVLQLCSAPRPSLETRIAHVISRNCPEKISKIGQLLNQITDKYLLTVLERIHTNNNNNNATTTMNRQNINTYNSLPSSQEDDDTFTHSLSSLRALFINQLSDDQQDFLISNYFDEYDLMSTFVAARENLNLPPSSYNAYAKSFETPTVSPCLFDLIVAHKKIPTFTMANLILAQLAEGLKHLHENMRCVHRDLKTENIVVSTERRAILLRHKNDSNNNDGTVYGVQFEEKIQATIVDFGFTKALDVDTPIFNRYLNESTNNNFGSSTSNNNNDAYFDNEIVGLVNPQDFIVAVEEAVGSSSSKSESQECHHQYAVFNNTNQDGAVNDNNNTRSTKTTMMPCSLTPCGTDIYNSFEFLIGVVSSYDKILSQCGSISAKRRPRWSHLSMLFDGNSSPSSEFENNERSLLTKMDAWGLGGIAFCCFHGRPAFRMNCTGGQQAMKNMSDHVRLRILKGIVEHGPKYDDFGSSNLTNHVVGMCSNLMKKELCDRWSAGQSWNYLMGALKNSSSSFGDDESTSTQNMILVSEYRAPTSCQAHENSFVHRIVDCSETNFFATSFENNFDYDDWNDEEEECEENYDDDDCLIREEYCDHQEEENGRRSVTSSTNSSLRRSGGQNNNNSEEEQQEEDEIDDIYLF